MRKRINQAMPLIALMFFLYAGLYEKNWLLAFTAILIMPIFRILLLSKSRNKFVEASPLICLFVFLVVGFGFDRFDVAWFVFLLIPLNSIVFAKRFEPRKLVTLFVTLAFIGIGLWTKTWHPTWIIFLMIPIINIIFFPQKHSVFSFDTSSIREKFKDIIEINPDEDKD